MGQEHHHVLSAKIIYKKAFFFHNCLFQVLEPVLSYMALVTTVFYLMYFLPKKDPVEQTFSWIRKLLMNLAHEHKDTYDETFFFFAWLIRVLFHITAIQKNLLLKYKFQHCIYYCDNEPWKSTAAGRVAWTYPVEAWEILACVQHCCLVDTTLLNNAKTSWPSETVVCICSTFSKVLPLYNMNIFASSIHCSELCNEINSWGTYICS